MLNAEKYIWLKKQVRENRIIYNIMYIIYINIYISYI